MEFFGTIGRYSFAVIGAAFAFIIPGIGSSKAVGAAGQSAAGVLSEDPTVCLGHGLGGFAQYTGDLWVCHRVSDCR